MEKPLAVFKAARLFSPVRIHEIQPTASDLDQLKVFPFLEDSVVLSNLKVELPSYLAKASQVNSDFDILKWWKLNVIYHKGCFRKNLIGNSIIGLKKQNLNS